MTMLLPVLAIFGLSLKNIKWGVLALPAILPLYLWRTVFFGVPTTFLELSIYAVFLAWLIHLLMGKPKITYKTPFTWALIFLSIAAVISAVVSSDLRMSLGLLKGWFIDPLFVYVLVINILKPSDLKNLFFSFAVGGGVLSFFGLYCILTGQLTYDGRLAIFFENPNQLSLYLVPMIIFALVGVQTFKNWRRYVGVAAAVLAVVSLIFTYSYGGLLALIGALVATSFFMFRQKWLVPVAGIIVLIGLLFLRLANKQIASILDIVGRSSSSVRLEVWQTSWQLVKENSLFGLGLGRFQPVYLEKVQQLFTNPLELNVLHPHNLFLAFWLNLGFAGLFIFLWILIRFFAVFAALIKKVDSKNRLILLGLFAVMTATVIHGLVDVPYWKNDLSVIFIILLASLSILYGAKEDSTKT